MTEENPSYYSIIPASVRYDKRLKPNEKILYSEISVLCRKEGYCYSSNEYFAKLYDVHKVTISNWISNLQKYGYITIVFTYKEDTKEIDKRYIYLSEVILIEIAKNYCENHDGGINDFINRYKLNHLYSLNENTKDNNTSINNSTTTNNSIFEDVFDIIQNNFGRTLNELEYDTIKSWKNYNFPVELLIYAIKKTVLKNIYNISYIDKILYEWNKNNIRTLEQAQKSDEEHSNKKKQFKPVYRKRETEQERYERQLREAEEYDRQEALRNEQG